MCEYKYRRYKYKSCSLILKMSIFSGDGKISWDIFII